MTHTQYVRLLWERDWPVAETSTQEQITLRRDRHPSPGGIRTRNPSKRVATDSPLRRRGHWGRSDKYEVC